MEKLQDFFYKNPQYFGLFFIAMGLVLLLGAILDWDWVIQSGEGPFDLLKLSQRIGRGAARIVMAIIGVLAIVCGLFYFLFYTFKKP